MGQLLADTPLTFLDVETTGTSPKKGDRIIEIAMLQVKGEDFLGHVDALVNPQRSLRADAMRVNGITPDMVVGQPTFAEVLPDLHELLEGCVVVGPQCAVRPQLFAGRVRHRRGSLSHRNRFRYPAHRPQALRLPLPTAWSKSPVLWPLKGASSTEP